MKKGTILSNCEPNPSPYFKYTYLSNVNNMFLVIYLYIWIGIYALSVHSQWGVLDNNFEVSNFSTEIKSCFFTHKHTHTCVRIIDTGYCKSANGNKMCMKRYFCRKLALNLWKHIAKYTKISINLYGNSKVLHWVHHSSHQCNSILLCCFFE